MTPLVEPTHPETWFLVRRDGLGPDVLMEFDSRQEAEDALCSASVELLITLDADADADGEGFPIAIYTAGEMLDDPTLTDALALWDAQVEQLEIEIVQAMDDLILGETPPILRPGRRSPP